MRISVGTCRRSLTRAAVAMTIIYSIVISVLMFSRLDVMIDSDARRVLEVDPDNDDNEALTMTANVIRQQQVNNKTQRLPSTHQRQLSASVVQWTTKSTASVVSFEYKIK